MLPRTLKEERKITITVADETSDEHDSCEESEENNELDDDVDNDICAQAFLNREIVAVAPLEDLNHLRLVKHNDPLDEQELVLL